MLKEYEIYTDGSCWPNPGPGAWAFTATQRRNVFERTGTCPATTNNRMELTAVIEALKSLPDDSCASVYTDSTYVLSMVRRAKTNRKNADLWVALQEQLTRHHTSFSWVKAHAGNPGNEFVDQLANAARIAA